jgi:Sulfotransferase domain
VIATEFQPPGRREFPAWIRLVSYVPLFVLGVPLAKTLELAGRWPPIATARYARYRQQIQGSMASYRPTSHDVFACVGFKSGTTWLMQITVQIGCLGEAEFDNILSVVPWPDCPPYHRKYVIPLTDDSPARRSPAGLRVIKTHLPQSLVPYSAEARYISMVRDPKDAIVSGYHFIRSLGYGPLMPTVRHWVELNLSGDLPWGSWASHVAGFWRLRHEPNVLFLTYEQLSADLDAGIRRIARFMGVQLSAAQFEAVIEASTFEGMKRSRDKFETGRLVPWGKARGMLRSGKPGRSSELLSPQLRQRIDDQSRAELQRLNCDFPYDELYASGKLHQSSIGTRSSSLGNGGTST